MTTKTCSLSHLSISSTNPPPPIHAIPDIHTHLKNLTLELVNCMNTKDFTPFVTHLASTFTSNHSGGNETIACSDGQQLIVELQSFLRATPNYSTTIRDMSASVDERKRKGKVWVVRSCEGFTDGLKREVVAELAWVRAEGGRWFCWRYRGLRMSTCEG